VPHSIHGKVYCHSVSSLIDDLFKSIFALSLNEQVDYLYAVGRGLSLVPDDTQG